MALDLPSLIIQLMEECQALHKEDGITRLPSFSDERGAITNIISGWDIGHVAVITSKAGSIRGNHYHPRDHQFMYLVSGAYRGVHIPVDREPWLLRTILVTPGMLVYCPPGIAHSYQFIDDSIFLNITADPREVERFSDHTIPYDFGDIYGPI